MATSASEPTKYLCVANEGSGTVSTERWLLEEVAAKVDGPNWSTGDKIWKLSREGSGGIKIECSDWSVGPEMERIRGDTILCRGVYEMVVNKPSQLFVLSYSSGYVVGKCSAQ
jgi:hypothetical protein